MTIEKQVRQIIAFNHSWKRQKELLGGNSPVANLLKLRKSSLQVELLRNFPEQVYLVVADDNNEETELLYSVRLNKEINVNNVIRRDVEHLPARIAEEYLTESELTRCIKG
jgi:hypothetical protein